MQNATDRCTMLTWTKEEGVVQMIVRRGCTPQASGECAHVVTTCSVALGERADSDEKSKEL